MSMARCDDCERLIDSDDDPDCFIETSSTTTVCRCETCRDEDEGRCHCDFTPRRGPPWDDGSEAGPCSYCEKQAWLSRRGQHDEGMERDR